jgi:hypothetical protein
MGPLFTHVLSLSEDNALVGTERNKLETVEIHGAMKWLGSDDGV